MGVPEIVFVCWGNICRSPMAEMVAQDYARRAGVNGVSFTSAGISAEEQGNPIDPRAAEVLRRNGYQVGDHQAHRISAEEATRASMVIGMEQLHLDRLRQAVPALDDAYLLSDFDPEALPGAGVPDPWYGPDDGFIDTLRAIEAAMPQIIKRAAELTDAADSVPEPPATPRPDTI